MKRPLSARRCKSGVICVLHVLVVASVSGRRLHELLLLSRRLGDCGLLVHAGAATCTNARGATADAAALDE